MGNVINTNVSSLFAQASLDKTGRGLDRSLERLSSGLRINSARDDAAGLAIANRLSAQVGGLRQAVRNANDGIALAQTAEGALSESTSILLRMRDLAVQAVNDTNDGTDRNNIQKEITQLQSELNRIATTTRFSGKKLLDGNFAQQSFQVGAFANETISFSISGAGSSSLGNYDVSSAASTDAILGTASASNTNGVLAQTLTVTGFSGQSSFTTTANDSAKDLATAVNNIASATGVTAEAVTSAELSTVSTGTLSFTLTGSASSTVTASVTTSADLTLMRDALNDAASVTGVTAAFKVNATTGLEDKSVIVLNSSDGEDIIIEGFTDGDASATSSMAFSSKASTAASAVTLDDDSAGATASATVSGSLNFSSSKSFTVASSIANSAVAAAADTAVAGTLSAVSAIDVGTATGATASFAVIDQALQQIDDIRATLGAVQNRLVSTINNLTNVANNQDSARSQIIDADFAVETASLTKFQILQQAGVSILAQSNSRPQAVLSLLQ